MNCISGCGESITDAASDDVDDEGALEGVEKLEAPDDCANRC